MADADRPEKIKDMIKKAPGIARGFCCRLENVGKPCKYSHKMYNFYMTVKQRYFLLRGDDPVGKQMSSEVKKLRDYLGMVWDMESSLYAQECLLMSLKNKLFDMRTGEYSAKPTPPEVPKVLKTAGRTKGIHPSLQSLMIAVLGVAGIRVCRWMYYMGDSVFPPFILRHVWMVATPWLILCAASGLAVLNGVIGIFAGMAAVSKENSDLEKAARKYDEDKKKYKADLDKWQGQVISTKVQNDRIAAERAVLEANIRETERQLESSRGMLDKIYSADIIHPKYRNLGAVSALYEYVDTSQCYQLEGPDGGYRLLENDIRLDRIVLKMNDVISRLDSIHDTQYRLYDAVVESRRRTESLLESVSRDVEAAAASSREAVGRLAEGAKRIEANGRLIAYNTERTQKELEYFNRMRYQLGDYDRVWNNRRP